MTFSCSLKIAVPIAIGLLISTATARADSSTPPATKLGRVQIAGRSECDIPGLLHYRGDRLTVERGTIIDRALDPSEYPIYRVTTESGEILTLPLKARVEYELVAILDDRLVVRREGQESSVPRACLASFEAFYDNPPAAGGDRSAGAPRPGMRVRITARPGAVALPGLLTHQDGHLAFAESVASWRSEEPSGGGRLIHIQTKTGQRVTVPLAPARFEAIFVRAEEDGIVVKTTKGEDENWLIPWNSVRLEIQGPPLPLPLRAIRGALVVGSIAGLLTAAEGGDSALGWGVLAAVVTAPVGLVVGAAWGGGSWKPVEPGKLRLSLEAVPRGAGLSLTVGFKGRKAR